MTRRVLVTTGNGMFGHAVVQQLLGREDIAVRAMVRDRAEFTLEGSNVEVVTADLDDPASLAEPLADVTHVFLATPMDQHIASREEAVVDAAVATGANPHVVVIYGAVDHKGESLDEQHEASIAHLQASGLPWTIVSPNSVMETSLDSLAEQVPMGVVLGMSGHGLVGLVALDDVARVVGCVLTTAGHEGHNYECTGPEAVDMPYVTAIFSRALDRKIDYYDLPEDDFAKLLMDHGGYHDRATVETQVLSHLRAWREGRAEKVTDTVMTLTGRPATSVGEWVRAHLDRFDRTPSMSDRMAGFLLRTQYRKYRMRGEHRYEAGA